LRKNIPTPNARLCGTGAITNYYGCDRVNPAFNFAEVRIC
jgi:hypothetical protein